MPITPGFPIVLTADRTLMADYRLLFDGMLAASQTSTVPPELLSGLLMPRAKHTKNQSRVAPLGLRRIEAALLNGGFRRGDVAVVDMYHLSKVIGPATRIVALTSGEPTGLGMNSSTMTEIAGGRIYPEVMFQRLIQCVQKCIAKSGSNARVILGGPGAWQLANNPASQAELGIDHVVLGYAEGNAADIFRAIVNGENLSRVITGEAVSPENVPPIRGASSMGVVEISRGCGLGCSFCTIASVPMMHIPESTILADACTNIEQGNTSIAILSEDCFRYGANGMKANPSAFISLLRKLRSINGLRLIQIDHANICSIAQYSDEELRMVHDLLIGDYKNDYPWLNLGIETASGSLLKSIGGAAKMGRCSTNEWGSYCAAQIRRLCNAGFMPMASLIIGLPEETDDDIQQTLDWVTSLSNERITVFPMLNAPIDGSTPIHVTDLSKLHWKLIKACYKLNFKWTPRMYWHNQTGAGVSIAKRVLLQIMGNGQVLQWNALFALHERRARR